MIRVLIIETSAFWGCGGGGSFVQAKFYLQFLQSHDFSVEFFQGDRNKGRLSNLKHLMEKLCEVDCVVGFGTPLLGIYLQWLCLIFNKKGVFCVDTIIVYKSIFWDHFRRRIFPLRMILENLWWIIDRGALIAFPPPWHNLEFIASCNYIREALKGSFCELSEKRFLYARILLNNKRDKKVRNRNKNVLFYGALFRGRGVIDLIRASKILWRRGYRFKLVILGYPIEPYTLKTIEAEVKKEKRIFIHGKVKFPEKYLQQATVATLPFRYACSFQTPLTLLEPMYLGVPIITTDVGSHREWVKDGETGLFCKRNNPHDLAKKIALILDDKVLADKIAKNAANLVRSVYDSPNPLLEILEKFKPYNYRAKLEYAKINPDQYQDSRFRGPAGKMIDEVEKKTVLDLLMEYKPEILERGLRILDVATGPGRLAFFVEKYFPKANITGADINDNMLIAARKLAVENKSQVIFRRGDLYKLPFSNKGFDAVIGLRFSMHLPNFKDVLNEFSRVLKNDGVIIFDIFNADSLLRLKSGEGFYKLPEISRLAEECGFQLQTHKGIVLLGETVIRHCPPKLFFLLKPLVLPANVAGRFSTKLVLLFRKVK